MKHFHISDVLSVTIERLVSNRYMEGVYSILNFLTSDNLYTHQLPRAYKECQPWLRSQFPALMEDSPGMRERLADLDCKLDAVNHDPGKVKIIIQEWVETIRQSSGLPEMLPVYELNGQMHTYIDPIEEAKAMVGDNRVIVVAARDAAAASQERE